MTISSKQKIVRRGSVWGTGLTGNRPLGLRGFILAVNRLGGALFSFFHPWELHTNKRESLKNLLGRASLPCAV